MLVKSSRNKTIDISVEEDNGYFLKRCLSPTSSFSLNDVLDKTINGDTFEVLKRLPDNFVDLLIVDPPYNLNKDFHGSSFKRGSIDEYAEYTDAWLNCVVHCLKPTASIYVCVDWLSSTSVHLVLNKYFNVRNRITWQREKGRGAKTNWKNGMEDIWFATNSNEYVFNVNSVKVRRRVLAPYKDNGEAKDWEETADGKFRNTYPSNFWDDISIPYWSMDENTAHPTQKPEKLIAKLILASSNEGDVILDPFLGSGTTSVVAKKLNRRFVGIEQNPLYCIWAEKRLDMAESDKTIQGYSDGVFWERNTSSAQKKFEK